MNLSKTAKNEIAVCPKDEHCLTAMLSALVHTAGTITFDSTGMGIAVLAQGMTVEFASNAFKMLYGVRAEHEGGRIVVRDENVADILVDLGILSVREGLRIVEGINPRLIKNDCCAAAYLRGAFLGCGSLSLPKSGYNLELCFNSRKMAEGSAKLLERFEIKPSIMDRRGKSTAYIKDKDLISDFLAAIGAAKAMLELNSLIVQRDMLRDSARRTNCDMANLDKTVAASLIQREAILALSPSAIKSKALRDAAAARLKYPEYSYEELAAKLGISKSAVKYRLNRLTEIYHGTR